MAARKQYEQKAVSGVVLLAFALYLLTMNLPSLLLTILTHKGSCVLRLSETARKNLPVIKIKYGVLFAAFAVWMSIGLL